MGVEDATYISQFDSTLPTASDAVSQGDNHLRLIKSVLQGQFTTLGAAAVTTTAAELNLLDGKTTLAPEGTAVLSTGETGGTKFLREDGDNSSSWQAASDTTYTAGDGLDLTGTAFSTDLMSNGGLEIQSTELSVSQGISQYDVAQFAASVADNDFLRIATTSVEGRSASEVLSDIAALPLVGGAMTGAITTNSTFDGIDVATRDAVLTSTTTTAGAALPKAGGTMTGTIAADDQQITKPRLTDYSETVAAAGTKTAAFNLDLESGNVQTLTMSGGGTFNIGITNALSSHSNSITILGTNLGSVTATFYAGAHDGGGNKVYWAGGDDTSNNLMTASGTDVVTFTTFDGGTKFYGFVAGKEMTNA